MARPKKTGLEYFNVECNDDIKMELLESKFGVMGSGLYFKILRLTYREGYYINFSSQEKELLFCKSLLERKIFDEIFEYLLENRWISKIMLEENEIITSRGIQKRYLDIVIKAKRTSKIDKFNLLLPKKPPKNVVSSEETSITSEETPENVEESTQSKVNKSKQKKRKEKKSTTKEKKGVVVICKEFDILSGPVKAQFKKYGTKRVKEAFNYTIFKNPADKAAYFFAALRDGYKCDFTPPEEKRNYSKLKAEALKKYNTVCGFGNCRTGWTKTQEDKTNVCYWCPKFDKERGE